MPRIKPTATVIANLEQADAALQELAAIERQIGEIEDRMNAVIDAAKAEADAASAHLRGRKAALAAALTAYATHHKEGLFAKARTVALTFGSLSWRRSSELKPAPKHTWGGILAKIKQLGLTEGVRTKEEVDREALRQWSAERLELVGACLVDKDTFGYELNQQALAAGKEAA